MKFWSIAIVAMILAGVAATKATNPSHALTDSSVASGVPVTTLHTPVTP
ncbi:hypothetical protein SIAM614_26593 [Stappia aggregata IAM 12614]|uniref:Uncharacterized protein n=1 Tax=Roseibium aggregatum (strain ATCC 25650 / DSM 13394 / JCM 20685 / NBRC 16684 / NCIMB 2208 / IAM 12614 / B1) TaxID=384765 RepID=A0NWW3_ROSAI|nr:hypothetical protein [Roseibium aggregatum]EAV42599.1 hypothetical protein SIAM614_26593 [Stappia aggregata IAM 12614] [Roseibium aggregatum IAM 12614]MEE4013045.1 hypothetical protein [Roseibium sp. FZY0029]